jgi:hypothetical protein
VVALSLDLMQLMMPPKALYAESWPSCAEVTASSALFSVSAAHNFGAMLLYTWPIRCRNCCPLLLPQAARLAVSRAHPPLAACARVWALRQGPLGRLEPGSWASAYHLAAAGKERVFWNKVCLAAVCSNATWSGGLVMMLFLLPEFIGWCRARLHS